MSCYRAAKCGSPTGSADQALQTYGTLSITPNLELGNEYTGYLA